MAADDKPAELPKEQPPMELKQHESGLWMYHRPAWAFGAEIPWNGVSTGITTREAAEAAVNVVHPGAFPDKAAE